MPDNTPDTDRAGVTAGPDSDPDRHPVDVVAEEFAAQCRRGDRPSVGDYVKRYPQWAEQLREVLPPIGMMEQFKRRGAASRPGRSGSGSGYSTVSPRIERVGDFRVLHEIGRGGMGVVYEAEQESLGRHVALKLLTQAAVLDPQQLRRFEREAKAAAGLHHTNIVQVFGVGDQGGLHYYVMQLIRGRSLSQVLAEMGRSGTHPATAVGTGNTAVTQAGAGLLAVFPESQPPTEAMPVAAPRRCRHQARRPSGPGRHPARRPPRWPRLPRRRSARAAVLAVGGGRRAAGRRRAPLRTPPGRPPPRREAG